MPIPLSDSKPVAERVEYSLLTPEELAARRGRRRALFGLAGALVLGAGVWFGARPVVHAIKSWQARRIAAQAMVAINAGNWNLARAKVQDAHALRPNDPEVIRTTAVFLTRAGLGREAVSYWKVLESTNRLTINEHRDFATAALAMGDVPLARQHLAQAGFDGEKGTPADWWLGLQIALRARQADDVQRLARQLIENPGPAERQRLGAAQTLAALDQPDATELGWKTVESIARGGRSAESLDALLLLARRAAATFALRSDAGNAPAATGAGLLSIDELIPLIERHPLAKATQKLLIYDLRLLERPGDRGLLIKEAVEHFAGSKDLDDLAALAGWLYGKGEYAKIQEILPLDKALGSRALFLQYLDMLGATGHWLEIKDLIEGQRFPLDPMLQQMYLARCSEQLGRPEAGRAHWTAAIDGAKGNAEKLSSIGQYAERNGDPDFAELAYRGAYSVAPQSRAICESLLHIYERRGETRKMLELLQKALVTWPSDDAMHNDVVYLSLLVGDSNPANIEKARELVRANPESLPRRVTLALAEYRLGRALSALDAFSGVPGLGAGTPARYLSVYAAVLWATDFPKEAKQIVGSIQQDQLLPEEKEIIRPILEG